MSEAINRAIVSISKLIGHEWKLLGRGLGFTKTDLDSIEVANPHLLKEQIHDLFYRWRIREGRDASVEQLVVAAHAEGLDHLLEEAGLSAGDLAADDFENALKLGQVDVAYGRVMFIGAAGVGKTTLLEALMNKSPKKKATSTIMADTRRVKVQSTDEDEMKEQNQSLPEEATSNTKALNFQWKRADWCNVTEEDEVKELAVLAKKVMDIGSDHLLEDLKSSFAVTVFDPKVNSDSHDLDTDKSVSSTLFEENAFKTLKKIIDAARSYMGNPLEPITDQYLSVWDCGGQRVFLDILPAFLTSRSIFLLMFNASKDLQDKVEEIWNEQGISTKLETLNLSSQDLLNQWMSCIHASLSGKAMEFYKRQSSEAASVIDPPFPRIVVIGTHGDKLVSDAQKNNIISNLESSFSDGRNYFDQVLGIFILDSTKRGNEEDPTIIKVKRTVREFVSDALCFPTPIAWVLFRKLVAKLTKSIPVISLDDTKCISRVCSIDNTTLPSVLCFYHELGVFLHYADIDKLKDKVIAHPEWLVKHIGAILVPKESGKSKVGPRGAWKLLREKGILVEPLYQEVWKTSNTEHKVEPQAIPDLLEHCFLIAEIAQEIQLSGYNQYKGKKYFMPCALNSYDNMQTQKKSKKSDPFQIVSAAPLHLTFNSIYAPPGFFVRLVTILSRSKGFSIEYTFEMYSNRITFIYGEKIDHVTISGSNVSIQVDITRHEYPREYVEKHAFDLTCRSILECLTEAVRDLKSWFPSIIVKPGFQCESSNLQSPHFVDITDIETSCLLVCPRCVDKKYPTAEQQYWLKIPATTVNADGERRIGDMAQMVGEDLNERGIKTGPGGVKKRRDPFGDNVRDTYPLGFSEPSSPIRAKIVNADISKVAGNLSNWQLVAKELGFGEQNIKDIETNHQRPVERRIAFLREWIGKEGSKATYEKLSTALENLHEQGAADEIRKIASKH